jgi:hypothetical protein
MENGAVLLNQGVEQKPSNLNLITTLTLNKKKNRPKAAKDGAH